MSILDKEYDVLVVGAGVAGVHAAHAAALDGAGVLLLTSSWDTVAALGWGPSWYGAAPGKERPLPGFAGKALAKSLIYKGSRGHGVLTLIDSFKYQAAWKHHLETMTGITVFQDTCEALEVGSQGWTARTSWGATLKAKTMILAIGTCLLEKKEKGRLGDSIRRLGACLSIPDDSENLAGESSGKARGRRVPVGTRRSRNTAGGRTAEFAAGAEYLDRLLGIVVARNQCRSAPTVAAHSIDWSVARRGAVGKTAAPVRMVSWTQAAGRARIELAPTSVAGDQVYLMGWEGLRKTQAQRDDERLLREIPGLQKAYITRPALSVDYLTVSAQALTQVARAEPASGLFFAGRLAGATTYSESAEQGLQMGAAAAGVSRGT